MSNEERSETSIINVEKETRENELEKHRFKELDQHQKQVNGKEHGLFIRKNSALGENEHNPDSQENRKKKEREQHFYQTLLEQALEDMRLQIEELSKRIDSKEKLLVLLRKGELNKNNYEHTELIEQAGYGSYEEVQNRGVDGIEEDLIRDREEKLKLEHKAGILYDEFKDNPNSPKINALMSNDNNLEIQQLLAGQANKYEDFEALTKSFGLTGVEQEKYSNAKFTSEQNLDDLFSKSPNKSTASIMNDKDGALTTTNPTSLSPS